MARGWIIIGVLFAQLYFTPVFAAFPVQFVVGEDLWQPGAQYKSGGDWVALICASGGCEFEAATLSVTAEKWQGHYDDEATAGQRLKFRRSSKNGEAIAWFRKAEDLPWLTPGKVITFASRIRPPLRKSTPGTLELAIEVPGAGQMLFVPLLDQANEVVSLQFRTAKRRQVLGQLGGCSHQYSTGYFLFAGDIDRDGAADFLVSFVDADGDVVLYSSAVADTVEVLRQIGVFHAPPFGGECDG